MEVDHSGYRLALLIFLLIAALATLPVQADQFRILSQNMNRLIDDVDDGNDAPAIPTSLFERRVTRAANSLVGNHPPPHLIALQEIENLHVLQRIADAIQRRHALSYRPIMAAGKGFSPIGNGYLVHPQLTVSQVISLFAKRRVKNSGGRLFSRPPLQLDLCFLERCATVLNLHLRSMRGIDSTNDGYRVAARRRQQAQTVAQWIDRQQRTRPSRALMVLGDFNAMTPSDHHVDVTGIIRGAPNNTRTRLDSPDLIARDLVDLTRRIPHHRRYSYIYRGRKRQLDYLFVNKALAARILEIRYDKIDYSYSDHAALHASFHWR